MDKENLEEESSSKRSCKLCISPSGLFKFFQSVHPQDISGPRSTIESPGDLRRETLCTQKF